MTAAGWVGALLGLIAAVGVIVTVRAAPPMRPIRLHDRLAPYLADTPSSSRLLAPPPPDDRPFGVVLDLAGPVVRDVARGLDRLIGGTPSVRRRLAGLGSSMTVEEFRLDQVLWGCLGALIGGVGVAGLTALWGSVDPVSAGATALAGLVAGVLGRDWMLGVAVRRREEAILAEFPVVADLLALAVVAGESPVDALTRVCRLADGELTSDLRSALDDIRVGVAATTALTDLAARTSVEPLNRFLQGMVVALERGTPMADVLRAQATDVRESAKRSLLEAGGKKEISMMLPVVFLILPVTILFALYPGLVTLTSLTQ
ncbi:MAG: type II secretion system F family protein [Jatrophihabitans sp.]